MYPIDDPDEMTPAERFHEVAWLLAKGFSRLERRNSLSASIDSSKLGRYDQHTPINASERLNNAGISAKVLDFPIPLSHCSNRINTTKETT